MVKKKAKNKKQNLDLKLGFNSNTLSLKLHLLRRFWCMALWIAMHICSLVSVTMSHV